MEMKKILVVGIIFLFISVAVAPNINQSIAKASYDDDLVEVTAQACGIEGYEDATVTLTKEQYQDLEQYLDEFREQLNQTTTREEAVPLFKEAMMELESYQLLPKGMSVEQAQKLIATERHLPNVPPRLKNSLSGFINVFCFFAAVTNDVVDYNVWVVLGAFLSQFIQYDSPFVFLVYLFFLIGFLKPLRFCNILVAPPEQGEFTFYFTLGLKGISTGMNDIGNVIGFTGLKIMFTNRNAVYLGSALAVTS